MTYDSLRSPYLCLFQRSLELQASPPSPFSSYTPPSKDTKAMVIIQRSYYHYCLISEVLNLRRLVGKSNSNVVTLGHFWSLHSNAPSLFKVHIGLMIFFILRHRSRTKLIPHHSNFILHIVSWQARKHTNGKELEALHNLNIHNLEHLKSSLGLDQPLLSLVLPLDLNPLFENCH